MTIFSKKHYEKIARTLKEVEPTTRYLHPGWTLTGDALIKMFQSDNPKFDKKRFEKVLEEGR